MIILRIFSWTLSIVFVVLFFVFYYNSQFITNEMQRIEHDFVSFKTNTHVVLIGQELDNPYWQTVASGAQSASSQYNISLEYIAPIQSNVEEQKKLLEKAIARKVDGIVVQSIQKETFAPLIDRAITKGIPVITIDNDAPESKRLTYVGTNQFQAGFHLGTYIAARTKTKEKIGIIIGDPNVENQSERLRGVKEGLARNKQLHIVDIKQSDISRIKAMQQAELMLLEHPEISIMIGTSALDGPGITQAIEHLQFKNITVYAFDFVDETMELIQKQKIEATLQQEPFMMGYHAMDLLHKAINAEPLPKHLYTDTHIMTANELEYPK